MQALSAELPLGLTVTEGFIRYHAGPTSVTKIPSSDHTPEVLDRQSMRFAKAIGILRKRAPLYLGAKLLLSLLFLVSAASITISTTPLQAEHGGAISFSNNLVAADRGISRNTLGTADAGTSCSGNVTFTTGTIQQVNIGLTVNHFAYTIQVNTTAQTPSSSCFTVTLTMIASGNTNTYVLHLATNATVVADQAVNCVFDIGSALPPSPYSFSVAVQRET